MEAQSKISLKVSERRWKILLERTRRSTTTAASTARHTDHHKHPPEEDPFDCTSLAVPPTFDLVKDVAIDFVQQWRDLDERKVVADGVVINQQHPADLLLANGDDNEEDDEDDPSSQGPRKKPRVETVAEAAASSVLARPVWYDRHVRLPEDFDYASRQSEPPLAQPGDDRVISLTDPNQLLSYHEELWNLFRSIPTVAQLEEDVVNATATVPEAEEDGHNSSCMRHTQKLLNEITDTLIVYPRLDGHALSRLRYNDRHDPVPTPPVMQTNTATTAATADDITTNFIPTIRFECWRRQPRRGTTPDPNRMVLEFAGSQTLLDFHWAIVELAEDFLWSSNHNTPTTTNTDTAAATDSTDTTTISIATTPPNPPGSSGLFFLEGVFYTTGSVDYTSPILTWLRSGSQKEKDQRAAHLGLPRVTVTSSSDITVRSMADTLLEDLSLRLGVRYLYCCHGDAECSILCTDRRLVPKSTTARYPIVHDVWMPSYLIPECEACRHRVAMIATSTECQQTGGHVALCEDCSRQLQLQTLAPDKVQEYSVWRSQADLSAGAASESLF
jgi:hypothetical protein